MHVHNVFLNVRKSDGCLTFFCVILGSLMTFLVVTVIQMDLPLQPFRFKEGPLIMGLFAVL